MHGIAVDVRELAFARAVRPSAVQLRVGPELLLVDDRPAATGAIATSGFASSSPQPTAASAVTHAAAAIAARAGDVINMIAFRNLWRACAQSGAPTAVKNTTDSRASAAIAMAVDRHARSRGPGKARAGLQADDDRGDRDGTPV